MNCLVLWIVKLYNYNSIRWWNFNWLGKHIEKIRSSQDFFNTFLYWIKFSPVSIFKYISFRGCKISQITSISLLVKLNIRDFFLRQLILHFRSVTRSVFFFSLYAKFYARRILRLIWAKFKIFQLTEIFTKVQENIHSGTVKKLVWWWDKLKFSITKRWFLLWFTLRNTTFHFFYLSWWFKAYTGEILW